MTNPKILITDDDEWMVEYLSTIFKEDGWEIIPAYHYSDVLDKALHFHPDVIMLDVNLQDGVTGYDVAKELSTNPATKDIPITFITSESDMSYRVRAFACGAYDFFTKPFVKSEMLLHLRPLASMSKLAKSLKTIIGV